MATQSSPYTRSLIFILLGFIFPWGWISREYSLHIGGTLIITGIILGVRSFIKEKIRKAAEKKAERIRNEKRRIAEDAAQESKQQYNTMVQSYVSELQDLKSRALDIMGLDEDQIKEINPIGSWWTWRTDTHGNGGYTVSIKGKDGNSHDYDRYITLQWVFFTSAQVHVYSNTVDLSVNATNEKTERTEDFFYKEITKLDADATNETVGITVSSGHRYTFYYVNINTIRALQAKVREKKA